MGINGSMDGKDKAAMWISAGPPCNHRGAFGSGQIARAAPSDLMRFRNPMTGSLLESFIYQETAEAVADESREDSYIQYR